MNDSFCFHFHFVCKGTLDLLPLTIELSSFSSLQKVGLNIKFPDHWKYWGKIVFLKNRSFKGVGCIFRMVIKWVSTVLLLAKTDHKSWKPPYDYSCWVWCSVQFSLTKTSLQMKIFVKIYTICIFEIWSNHAFMWNNNVWKDLLKMKALSTWLLDC